jgi:hypothetical protein
MRRRGQFPAVGRDVEVVKLPDAVEIRNGQLLQRLVAHAEDFDIRANPRDEQRIVRGKGKLIAIYVSRRSREIRRWANRVGRGVVRSQKSRFFSVVPVTSREWSEFMAAQTMSPGPAFTARIGCHTPSRSS